MAVHCANSSSKVIIKVSPPRAAAVPAAKGSTTGTKDCGGSDVLIDLLLDKDCGGALGNSDRDGMISVPVVAGDNGTSMLYCTSGMDLIELMKQQHPHQQPQPQQAAIKRTSQHADGSSNTRCQHILTKRVHQVKSVPFASARDYPGIAREYVLNI